MSVNVPVCATIQPVSATRKPVIVRKFTRDWCAGYAASNVTDNLATMEMLDSSGKVQRIEWESIKWVCFVREFLQGMTSGGQGTEPERLLRRRFTIRPRTSGLWIRTTLSDGDELEGVVSNDRSLLDSVGLLLMPPDTRSNTQRIFLPRTSIREITVLAVIGTAAPARPKLIRQPDLFSDELPHND